VAGEHQLELDIRRSGGLLQRLLDAEAARIRRLAGRGLLVLRQFENWQALRQPMQLIWSVRISRAFAGVTKTQRRIRVAARR